MIEYARHLPYELGAAFVAVWQYTGLDGSRGLEDACRFLSSAISSEVVDGCHFVSERMAEELGSCLCPEWDDYVLVAIAEGGTERLMWALSEIKKHLPHE